MSMFTVYEATGAEFRTDDGRIHVEFGCSASNLRPLSVTFEVAAGRELLHTLERAGTAQVDNGGLSATWLARDRTFALTAAHSNGTTSVFLHAEVAAVFISTWRKIVS